MSTIAQRMREDAAHYEKLADKESCPLERVCYRQQAKRRRADADALEALEQEMREWDRNILTVQRYADRIRGEK